MVHATQLMGWGEGGMLAFFELTNVVGTTQVMGLGWGGMITFLALAHMVQATQLMGWGGGGCFCFRNRRWERWFLHVLFSSLFSIPSFPNVQKTRGKPKKKTKKINPVRRILGKSIQDWFFFVFFCIFGFS